MTRLIPATLLLLLISASDGVGQRAPSRFQNAQLTLETRALTGAPGSGQAFLVEAAGGVAGSLLGFGLVYLMGNDCDVEDLACNLEHAFGGIALSTATSAAGTYLAGRLGDTQPSGFGAILGSAAGAAAGIGMWHLFTEELDLINNDLAATLSYSVTQGIVTALGSRIGRALR